MDAYRHQIPAEPLNDARGAASRGLQRALFAVKDEMLADMRVDEIEAVVVARVPVNPDFTAGDASGDGRLKQIGVDFAAEMVVIAALVNPQR